MAPAPQRIADVLAELIARRGLGKVQTAEELAEAWRKASGELASRYTRVGSIRGGTLEVVVANSALVQELTFQKPVLVQELKRLLPEKRIENLRFRVGPVA
ncbi:MAG: DUF721 domain-containing protein [Pirellulales bacterium]